MYDKIVRLGIKELNKIKCKKLETFGTFGSQYFFPKTISELLISAKKFIKIIYPIDFNIMTKKLPIIPRRIQFPVPSGTESKGSDLTFMCLDDKLLLPCIDVPKLNE